MGGGRGRPNDGGGSLVGFPGMLHLRSVGGTQPSAFNGVPNHQHLERIGTLMQMKQMGVNYQKHILAKDPPGVSGDAAVYGLEFSKHRQEKKACILYFCQLNYGLSFHFISCNRSKLLFSSHSDGFVRIHDERSRKVVETTPNFHKNSVNGTTSVDSNLFASFSDDCKVLVWDLRRMTSPLKEVTRIKCFLFVKLLNIIICGKICSAWDMLIGSKTCMLYLMKKLWLQVVVITQSDNTI